MGKGVEMMMHVLKNEVTIRKLDIKKANECLRKLTASEGELLRNYKSAFGNDTASEGGGFLWYMVDIDDNPEAIVRIKLPNSFSSLSRIVLKSNAWGLGWMYAKAIIEEILEPECRLQEIPVIYANTRNSRGGKSAFESLEDHLPKGIERITWGDNGPQMHLKS